MKSVPIILAVVLLTACGKPENTRRITPEQAVEAARDAAQDAFNSLSAELAATIAEGGPVHAIPVCSSIAGRHFIIAHGLGLVLG